MILFGKIMTLNRFQIEKKNHLRQWNFNLCDITCLQRYLLLLGQKIGTQENCKQDRTILAKSVQKEKKSVQKTFGQIQILFDEFYDASFFLASEI